MLKKISIKTGASFGFVCESSKLSGAITKALTVSSFSNSADNEKHHFILSSKGSLYVIGYSPETFIVIQVPNVETEKDGILGFTPGILQGLIKNRKELEFSFNKGQLDFKAIKGKYSANIETIAVTDDHVPHIERMLNPKSKTKASSMSGSLLEEIRKGVKCADLRDFYNDEQILCAIRVKDSTLDVSAHDNFHMSYYKAQVEDANDFELAIPVNTFKLIDRFISDEKEDADFFLDNKQFRIVGKTYMVTLPPVQVDEDYFDRVPGYIQSLKNPLVQLKFNAEAIRTVDNMFTIADDETRLSLTVQKSGNVGISLATESGKISDGFKSKKVSIDGMDKVSFMIDPRIFADLFGKVRDRKEVPMRLFSKRNKGVSSCFMISGSTETSKSFLVGTYYEE